MALPEYAEPTYSRHTRKRDFYVVKHTKSPAMQCIITKEHYESTGESFKEYKVFGVYTRKEDIQDKMKNKR